ncbi:precorrin-3B synthase [Mesorhizobium sp. B2-5-13]|uniref:precorrin-3B synthase n=1 Tax=unclassified Mesorhizobium TaxID=325217 RepID=UPI001126C299|nr:MULTISPECIES: precorrin-3B synthase [unclassified Mesorhizobium]TPJ87031.1 precorrin-3B synthase [Mesorhizobium sp. B2-5-13]TPK51806.1 precorrin-3B synthase [Mesorhizobium sp. B2-5-5]
MNAFSRRGACPALSAPMQTGDGLLVRLNPVSGGLSPRLLIELAEAALRHGNGIMEVTARGSMQIRGLTMESAALLAAEVDALGIAVRTGVPVETGPLAGIDPREIADPRPMAERIRMGIEEAGLAIRLGPKVAVVVDGGGQLTLDAVTADVRLAATRTDVGIQWRVSVAGDGQTAKPLAVADEDAARDIAVAALRMVAEKGREAHTRDLSRRQLESLAGWHSTAPPSVLPEGGAVERFHSPIRYFSLGKGHALGIGLAYGSMPADKIIGLAQKALALGATEIRLVPGRALLFLGQPADAKQSLHDTAATLGFVTSPADPRTRIAACPGTPACASGRIATRDIAEAIAAENADILDFTLHVSGCAKGCAHPGPAALTIVGGENGAGLVVNATAKGLPAGYRPGYDAARGISRVAAMIRSARFQGETAAACLTRLGPAGIAETYKQE